jgi:putative oxidoreductase
MDRWLGRLSELFYACLRLVAGGLFACHGAQKLFGVLGGHPVTGNALLTVAGMIELAGGALIGLGLFASWAAFLASGEMAYAYFTVHAPRGLFPIANGGELAAVYCFVFLYVAAHGSGRISLDALFGAGRRGSSRGR